MKTEQRRIASSTRLLSATAFVALVASAAPSFAGNYAEGDPRPAPFTSSTTRDAVTAEARRWLETAPTQGYTDGTPERPSVTVSANSRAAVAADTRLWLQSGLAAKQAGEIGADPTRVGYREAAAEYRRLVEQSGRQAAAR